MSEENNQNEIHNIPIDRFFRRITPKCPYCSHYSIYFYSQRPLKIRCANCERRFRVEIKLTFEPTKSPIEFFLEKEDFALK